VAVDASRPATVAVTRTLRVLVGRRELRSRRRRRGEGWGLGAAPNLVFGTLRLQVVYERVAVAVAVPV